MQSTVMVKERLVGFHCWPEAPEAVAYLRQPHRHLFTIIVAVNVTHDDRDVEFHMLQRDLLRITSALWPLRPEPGVGEFDFAHRSTEMLAAEMIDALRAFKTPANDPTAAKEYMIHPYRNVAWVEVWEDDECGSRVTPEVQR